MEVQPCSGGPPVDIAEADMWTLLNLKVDDILQIPQKLVDKYDLQMDDVRKAIAKCVHRPCCILIS